MVYFYICDTRSSFQKNSLPQRIFIPIIDDILFNCDIRKLIYIFNTVTIMAPYGYFRLEHIQ